LVNYKKGCTRDSLPVACPLSGTPASSTTKTSRHDIVELLLKVALNTINQSTRESFEIDTKGQGSL
jgi:hypothetical protein